MRQKHNFRPQSSPHVAQKESLPLVPQIFQNLDSVQPSQNARAFIQQSFDSQSEVGHDKKSTFSQFSNYVSNSKVTVLSKHPNKSQETANKDFKVRSRKQSHREVLQESYPSNLNSLNQQNNLSREPSSSGQSALNQVKMTKKSKSPWDQQQNQSNQVHKINFYKNFQQKNANLSSFNNQNNVYQHNQQIQSKNESQSLTFKKIQEQTNKDSHQAHQIMTPAFGQPSNDAKRLQNSNKQEGEVRDLTNFLPVMPKKAVISPGNKENCELSVVTPRQRSKRFQKGNSTTNDSQSVSKHTPSPNKQYQHSPQVFLDSQLSGQKLEPRRKAEKTKTSYASSLLNTSQKKETEQSDEELETNLKCFDYDQPAKQTEDDQSQPSFHIDIFRVKNNEIDDFSRQKDLFFKKRSQTHEHEKKAQKSQQLSEKEQISESCTTNGQPCIALAIRACTRLAQSRPDSACSSRDRSRRQSVRSTDSLSYNKQPAQTPPVESTQHVPQQSSSNFGGVQSQNPAKNSNISKKRTNNQKQKKRCGTPENIGANKSNNAMKKLNQLQQILKEQPKDKREAQNPYYLKQTYLSGLEAAQFKQASNYMQQDSVQKGSLGHEFLHQNNQATEKVLDLDSRDISVPCRPDEKLINLQPKPKQIGGVVPISSLNQDRLESIEDCDSNSIEAFQDQSFAAKNDFQNEFVEKREAPFNQNLVPAGAKFTKEAGSMLFYKQDENSQLTAVAPISQASMLSNSKEKSKESNVAGRNQMTPNPDSISDFYNNSFSTTVLNQQNAIQRNLVQNAQKGGQISVPNSGSRKMVSVTPLSGATSDTYWYSDLQYSESMNAEYSKQGREAKVVSTLSKEVHVNENELVCLPKRFFEDPSRDANTQLRIQKTISPLEPNTDSLESIKSARANQKVNKDVDCSLKVTPQSQQTNVKSRNQVFQAIGNNNDHSQSSFTLQLTGDHQGLSGDTSKQRSEQNSGKLSQQLSDRLNKDAANGLDWPSPSSTNENEIISLDFNKNCQNSNKPAKKAKNCQNMITEFNYKSSTSQTRAERGVGQDSSTKSGTISGINTVQTQDFESDNLGGETDRECLVSPLSQLNVNSFGDCIQNQGQQRNAEQTNIDMKQTRIKCQITKKAREMFTMPEQKFKQEPKEGKLLKKLKVNSKNNFLDNIKEKHSSQGKNSSDQPQNPSVLISNFESPPTIRCQLINYNDQKQSDLVYSPQTNGGSPFSFSGVQNYPQSASSPPALDRRGRNQNDFWSPDQQTFQSENGCDGNSSPSAIGGFKINLIRMDQAGGTNGASDLGDTFGGGLRQNQNHVRNPDLNMLVSPQAVNGNVLKTDSPQSGNLFYSQTRNQSSPGHIPLFSPPSKSSSESRLQSTSSPGMWQEETSSLQSTKHVTPKIFVARSSQEAISILENDTDALEFEARDRHINQVNSRFIKKQDQHRYQSKLISVQTKALSVAKKTQESSDVFSKIVPISPSKEMLERASQKSDFVKKNFDRQHFLNTRPMYLGMTQNFSTKNTLSQDKSTSNMGSADIGQQLHGRLNAKDRFQQARNSQLKQQVSENTRAISLSQERLESREEREIIYESHGIIDSGNKYPQMDSSRGAQFLSGCKQKSHILGLKQKRLLTTVRASSSCHSQSDIERLHSMQSGFKIDSRDRTYSLEQFEPLERDATIRSNCTKNEEVPLTERSQCQKSNEIQTLQTKVDFFGKTSNKSVLSAAKAQRNLRSIQERKKSKTPTPPSLKNSSSVENVQQTKRETGVTVKCLLHKKKRFENDLLKRSSNMLTIKRSDIIRVAQNSSPQQGSVVQKFVLTTSRSPLKQPSVKKCQN